MKAPSGIRWTALAVVALAMSFAGHASAAEPSHIAHCAVVSGSASYSPALDITASPTTMSLAASGSGCVDVAVGSGASVAIGSVDVSGTFTGTGSTILSNYSGGGEIVWHLPSGTTQTDTYSATCGAGALGVCPLLGTVTASTGGRAGADIEITPQTLTLNPLGTYPAIPYLELAITYKPCPKYDLSLCF